MRKADPERIIILTNTLKIGGAEKQSIMLAKALQDKYDTSLIVYYGTEYDIKLKNLTDKYNLNVTWLEGSHLNKIISLYKIFRKERNTVIFSYLATTNVLNAIIGSIAGVRFRIGGIRSARLPNMKMHVQKFLHNNLLTCSIFNNNAGREDLCSKGFKENKAFVIHNCIDETMPPKNPVTLKTILTIITVGRFVGPKDYFTSINAIAHLLDLLKKKETDINIKYFIIGYGHLEEEIRNYISEKHLNNHIELVINPPNISDYYTVADIYLSTSLFEGLSNSIMEAMSYGLTIVATDVGDNGILVTDEKNGFLVKPKDCTTIAEKLEYLIRNPELRNEIGKNNRSKIINEFSFETFRKRYLELIDGYQKV